MKFRAIYIEISNICNLKCSFCPAVKRAEQIMSTEEFARVLEQVAPYTQSVYLHLMGEPLGHPHFEEIIELCGQKQVPVNLTTNGVLLRANKHATLLHPTVRQINFSLHSFTDNFIGQDPRPYTQRIFAFAKASRLTRPDLYINYRLWDLDPEQQAEAENTSIRDLLAQEYTIDFPNLKIDVRRKKGYAIGERIYLHFDSRFHWPDLAAEQYGSRGRCYGLIDHIGVHANGTVVPCCLDKEAILTLGSLKSSSLQDILASPRAINIKDGFEKGELREPLCQRCHFVTRFRRKESKKTGR